MKLVKKLLRLLPFIILISMIIFTFFAINKNYSVLVENGYNNVFDYFISNYEEISANYGVPFFDMLYFSNSFYNIFESLEVSQSFLFSLDFILSTLIYELFLSFIFLCFDFINLVFIWANKFVNKGVDIE